MAQRGVQLDQESFSCSICLDLLKDPVTIPCGHSYCMNCVKTHWDRERRVYSCPQCRQTFKPRPVLMKNTMLAHLVEELKKTGLQDARPEDVDFRKLKVSQVNIQQRIQDRERDMKLLQREVEAINRSADRAVENSEKIFTEMIRLMEKRRSDVKQQVRSQQDTEVGRVRELQEKLEQEITELKRKDTDLYMDFLSPSGLSGSTPIIRTRPLRYFEDVTAAVSEVREKLEDVLRETWTNISQKVTEVDVLLSQPEPEPKTRAEFLKYACDVSLDPNSAHQQLILSEGDRKASVQNKVWCQSYSHHPDRFSGYIQVLSRESLTGRCYWEVEWRGRVYVAVSYKTISRSGSWSDCVFGFNDRAWVLNCENNSYCFWFNNVHTRVSGPPASRLGVYLDHRAGILSFYSITETMTLLHRVQTTFTQPLHAGLRFLNDGDTAEICKLK
ncbi:E3 ubiquitin/ISG15 ligase TRIM25-like [Xyrichtys novacula]|uniref:E3 ubiquitin/ISG15 ligase TRIM25-like n=1 Tax=Xyrichtys novacula TaxID=13765 RepID=A0AAV1GLD0_XYRNO|nr:E3 ubiquitin/ISG15 ligase TRIM25-like [Xyrichtys novacula]